MQTARVLVPLNPETVCEARIGVAIKYARALQADIVLLHVLPSGALDPGTVLPCEAVARTYLDTVAAEIEAAGVTACGVVRCGTPAAAIVAEAEAIGASLIVLGANVRPALPTAVLGSVADQVARLACCPTLLVRPDRLKPVPRHALRSFAEDSARAGALTRRHLGIRTIELGRVIGSLDRAHELGEDFRRRGERRATSLDEQRFKRVLDATRAGAVLPPISVHKLGFGYYVEDGHHRVAAARMIGQAEIEADVTEFVPAGDEHALALFAARTEFEHATGLKDIGAARPATYAKLLRTIQAYAHDEGIAELELAARRWQGRVFRPLWHDIRAREVGAAFPGERTADIIARLAVWRERTPSSSWPQALEAVVSADPPTARLVYA
jgi:nucleotide-binding universal stress UspA family protein